jgi:cytochrome c biogenesis protein CcdA
MISHYGLGLGAGFLSLLAPCVMPLIPLIFRSSMQSTKLGPIANALGLTLTFTLVGILTSLFSSIFNVDTIQKVGAVILIAVGLIFLFPKLKDLFSSKVNYIADSGVKLQGKIKGNGLSSQFLLGSLLGLIWAPCSGPTLAFAFGIATQADKFVHASLIFFFFGLGAGLGLILLGLTLKRFTSVTGKVLKYTKAINISTGLVSIAIGSMIITNTLGNLEEMIMNILPNWLINLSVAI